MKIAVVTGASSGMGKQFALQLSAYEQVDEIWAIARRKEALEALLQLCEDWQKHAFAVGFTAAVRLLTK